MTKCNVPSQVFQDTKSRKIEFSFDGGDISSDSGQLFIKEFGRKLGLTRCAGKPEISPSGDRQSGVQPTGIEQSIYRHQSRRR